MNLSRSCHSKRSCCRRWKTKSQRELDAILLNGTQRVPFSFRTIAHQSACIIQSRKYTIFTYINTCTCYCSPAYGSRNVVAGARRDVGNRRDVGPRYDVGARHDVGNRRDVGTRHDVGARHDVGRHGGLPQQPMGRPLDDRKRRSDAMEHRLGPRVDGPRRECRCSKATHALVL